MHEGDNNSSFLSNDLKKKVFQKKKNQTKCCYSHDVKNKTKKKSNFGHFISSFNDSILILFCENCGEHLKIGI